MLLGVCFCLTLVSFGQDVYLIHNVRAFVESSPPWGLLRLLGCLSPPVLVAVALLGPREKRHWLFWPLIFLGILALLDVTLGGRDPDEPVHLRMIWMMGEGLVPYRDFFTVRHLLWHAMCIPLTQLMEGSLDIIYVVRILMFLISLASLGLLVVLSRQCRSHPVAAVLVLAFPLFLWGSVEFRADPPMTLLLLAALIALARNSPVWAGVLSGVAFLMLQKAAFHGIAMGAGILISGMGLACFFRYSAAAVCISLLHALWALLLGIWDEYFICCVKSSGVFASFHQKTPFAESKAVLVFTRELAFNPALFLLAGLGVFLWWRSGDKFSRLMAVCLVLDLALVFAGKIAYKNYLLFPLALLALAASRSFQEWEKVETKSRLESALPTVMVLLIVSIGFMRHSAWPPTTVNLTEAKALSKLLPPQETYYANGHRGNLVSPIFRMSPNYYAHDSSSFYFWFKEAQVEPPVESPLTLAGLLQQPPGAFAVGNTRTETVLSALREVGVSYLEIMPGVYLRSDLVPDSFQERSTRELR